MQVTVRLFARLREAAGRESCVLEVAESSTVADVWRALTERHPQLTPFGTSLSAAVNADFARMTTVVGEADEIAFLPPVSGG
jgi:molybdopterin converting factor subunit 1